MDSILVRNITQKVSARNIGRALATLLILGLFNTGCGSVFHQTQQKQRFSVASLKGNYTYNLAGMIFGFQAPYNLYRETGAFVADGNGGISGFDDFSSGKGLQSNPFSGSYTMAGDGTGTMTLNLPGKTVQLAITMRSNTEVYLLEYDSFATGAGGALTQSSTSPLSGAYVFRVYSHILPHGSAAAFSSASVGQIVVSGTNVTGEEDFAQTGMTATQPLTGSITSPDQNGRGTLTLNDSNGASNYIYYVIDSNTLNLIRSDTFFVGDGRVVAQTGTSFNNASVNSGFAFRLAGDTLKNLGGINSIGAFTSDGSGNITAGALDSSEDEATTNQSFMGTYSVASNGRVTLTLAMSPGSTATVPLPQVGWMADSTQGFFLQQDQNSVAAGSFIAQQGGPFSASSLTGEYAFRMIGFDSPSLNSTSTVGRIGVVTFDGSATVNFADIFVNREGVQSQFTGLTGPYTVSANGRVSTQKIQGVSTGIVFYLTSKTSAYFLLEDGEIAGQSGTQTPQ